MTESSGIGASRTLPVAHVAESEVARALSDEMTRNDIPAMQDSAQSLDILAARADRYGLAHTIMIVQLGCVVVLPIALALAQRQQPLVQRWAAAYGTLALCLDLWLTRHQERLRDEGARVQECFDRRLFKLPWPDSSLGPAPAAADIVLWACQGRAKASAAEQSRWLNWYPRVLGQVPLSAARIACQQENGWWDARQRRTYASCLRVAGWSIPLVLAIYALSGDERVSAVANTLLTLAPLMAWCWQEAGRHTDVAEGRQRVMERARAAFARACAGASEDELCHEAADLQRDIYEQRRRAPIIPWLIYRRLRGDMESAMRHSADENVAEFRRHCVEPVVPANGTTHPTAPDSDPLTRDGETAGVAL